MKRLVPLLAACGGTSASPVIDAPIHPDAPMPDAAFAPPPDAAPPDAVLSGLDRHTLVDFRPRLSRIGVVAGSFVAVGESGRIATSTDGKTFTQMVSPTTQPIVGLARDEMRASHSGWPSGGLAQGPGAGLR